jgi:hypothetical protein
MPPWSSPGSGWAVGVVLDAVETGGHRAVVTVIVGEAGLLGLAGHRYRDLVTERRIPRQPGDGGCSCDAPVATIAGQDQQQAFH